MYKKRIILFAIITRTLIIILQFFSNLLIPDHDAGVFTYPRLSSNQSTYDVWVQTSLGGFLRWDAQYFMHIAKYGYTHENTLAFFPLYPLIVRIIASLTSYFITFLNEDSLLLISFIFVNIVVFTKASVELYKLTAVVLNVDLAYKSAMLFCINPASIFFVAPYTECLFSYLTFKSMLHCVFIFDKYNRKLNNYMKIIVPTSLSACIRSNGVLNIGFLIYFMVQDGIRNITAPKSLVMKLFTCFKNGILIICAIYLCLIPFVLTQYYFYQQFCTDFQHNLPVFLIDFIHSNDYVFPGMRSYYNQSWCLDKIPLAYSYIQSHYWNVGFLKYFECKQIPNFLLAAPIVLFLMYNNCKFFAMHKRYCLNLGIFNFNFSTSREKSKTVSTFKPKMFVFIVHETFLIIFCVFCIHVQVTTRMLCSASPVLYWFAAYSFKYIKEHDSGIRNMFLFQKHDFTQRLILYYFIGYVVIGTVMFTNFLPWT
ncbi:hypothetical protein PPYR_08759 [Photinus pyralis]|uniref:GPI mannosyltransferase 2 n=1 Tax=Photinus pyralis TaxID=7054 RepID=A0A5N4AKE0_PHOPY|nr:GPI mannosyltransferase 2 [Photinus pyralis]KAB0797766.1 hypothetical protein PPYR_08759 [Photinus pyralis]